MQISWSFCYLFMFKLLSDLFIRLLIRVYNQKYADALKTWNLQVGSKSNLETTETACSFDYCISKFLFFLKVAPFYDQLLFSPLWQDSLENKRKERRQTHGLRVQSTAAEKGDGRGCCRFEDQALMGHIVPTARKEKAMDSAALPRSFLLLSPRPQPME